MLTWHWVCATSGACPQLLARCNTAPSNQPVGCGCRQEYLRGAADAEMRAKQLMEQAQAGLGNGWVVGWELGVGAVRPLEPRCMPSSTCTQVLHGSLCGAIRATGREADGLQAVSIWILGRGMAGLLCASRTSLQPLCKPPHPSHPSFSTYRWLRANSSAAWCSPHSPAPSSGPHLPNHPTHPIPTQPQPNPQLAEGKRQRRLAAAEARGDTAAVLGMQAVRAAEQERVATVTAEAEVRALGRAGACCGDGRALLAERAAEKRLWRLSLLGLRSLLDACLGAGWTGASFCC